MFLEPCAQQSTAVQQAMEASDSSLFPFPTATQDQVSQPEVEIALAQIGALCKRCFPNPISEITDLQMQ